jgi:hypothetical protein
VARLLPDVRDKHATKADTLSQEHSSTMEQIMSKEKEDRRTPGSIFGCVNTMSIIPNRVWVTIYEVDKIHEKDWGWMEPGKERNWCSGNYLYGSWYWVRGEVKDLGGLHGTIADEWIEVHPDMGVDPWVTMGVTVDGSGFVWARNQNCNPPVALSKSRVALYESLRAERTGAR